MAKGGRKSVWVQNKEKTDQKLKKNERTKQGGTKAQKWTTGFVTRLKKEGKKRGKKGGGGGNLAKTSSRGRPGPRTATLRLRRGTTDGSTDQVTRGPGELAEKAEGRGKNKNAGPVKLSSVERKVSNRVKPDGRGWKGRDCLWKNGREPKKKKTTSTSVREPEESGGCTGGSAPPGGDKKGPA